MDESPDTNPHALDPTPPFSRIRCNGLNITHQQLGQGRPILLIMGIGAQMIFWPTPFCQLLADQGFRVIRYDHRDVGESTSLDQAGVPDLRAMVSRRAMGLKIQAPYTLEDLAQDAVALLDALDIDRAHVVGASMGGMVAQSMAIHHPQRLLSLTSMMSTTGARRHAVADLGTLGSLLTAWPTDAQAYADRAVEFLHMVGGTRWPLDEAHARKLALQAHARGRNPAGFVRHFAAICASGSRERLLPQVRVPTLVIHGTKDPLVPLRGGRATARAIPHARMLELEGMGHSLPPASWPELAQAILDHAGLHNSEASG
ncbi:MAG: alpha/beta hydrolase [Myxococcota bacterium]|jgi:pimeloyl-ACP methyl ester carboxylesterase|nr:alpha/beta hydrolase [Myxococcota bacterium]